VFEGNIISGFPSSVPSEFLFDGVVVNVSFIGFYLFEKATLSFTIEGLLLLEFLIDRSCFLNISILGSSISIN